MAKKATLTPVTDTALNAGAINTQLNAINDQLDNTLSLDGSTPNAMNADVDLNSNDILNGGNIHATEVLLGGIPLSTTVAASSASAAASAVASAASAVSAAASEAASLVNVTTTQNLYSGDDSTVNFTLPYEPVGVNGIMVYVDGVHQDSNSISTTGTALIFAEAPPTGTDNIVVRMVATGTTNFTTATNVVAKKEYATVALLLADTTDGTFFNTGDYVTVVEGGFSYKVAAVGDVTNAGGIQFDVVEHGATIVAFGALVDNSTDDTLAIQAMIDAFGYFRLPIGTTKITNSLTVPTNTQGSKWSGEGMEKSKINCVGMAGKPAIKAASATGYYRVTMNDFQIYGDADTCIDFTLTGVYLLYQSEFRNLVLSSSAGSAFVANLHFSTSWYNVHVSSVSGHGFDIQGGNSTVLTNCYAHTFTVGNGKAGYRIKGAATLIACNGLDSGDVWGIFGATVASDGANVVFKIVMIGCNLEDFDTHAIDLYWTGRISMDTNTFTIKSTGTYECLVKGDTYGSSDIIIVDNSSVYQSKGATRSGGSQVILNATPSQIQSNGLFPDMYRADQTLLYSTGVQGGAAPAYATLADSFTEITYDRSYGFNLQAPATWTANAATYSVTGKTKVKTANTVGTTFTNATGLIEGQELYILVKDANTTIAETAGGAGQFKNLSGANIVATSGDVYHYVCVDGVSWRQI